jgi:hypothetical protein
MKKLMIVALLGLAGCAGKPLIVDISSEKVAVQGGSDAAKLAKAREGCNLYGGPPKDAVPLSARCLDAYCIQQVALFACRAERRVDECDQLRDNPSAFAESGCH